MSFLLDALGKADDDRRRAEVPELKTYRQRKRSLLSRVLRIALLLVSWLVVFALGYFLRPHLEAAWSPGNEASRAVASEPPAEGMIDLATSQVPPPAQTNKEISALDLEVISWSENPQARFAMINGVVVYEGDTLSSGERLVEIKDDAVILMQDGSPVRLAM